MKARGLNRGWRLFKKGDRVIEVYLSGNLNTKQGTVVEPPTRTKVMVNWDGTYGSQPYRPKSGLGRTSSQKYAQYLNTGSGGIHLNSDFRSPN
jgi:hypothetical protein